MKRIVSYLLTFLIIFLISSINIFAVDSQFIIPEDATELMARVTGGQYRIGSNTQWIKIEDSSFSAPGSRGCHVKYFFDFLESSSSSSSIILDPNYTYYITVKFLSLTNNTSVDNDWNIEHLLGNSNSHYISSSSLPYSGGCEYNLQQYCTSFIENSSPVITFDIILHLPSNINNVSQFVLDFYSLLGSTQSNYTYVLYNLHVDSYYDINSTVYSKLVLDKLDSINSNLGDISSSVGNIESSLHDDSIGSPDPEISNSISEYEALEKEITDSVSNHKVTMPDGSVLDVNSSNISTIKEFFSTYYHAPGYEPEASYIITKIWDTFLPYVGIPVLFALSLGIAIHFLTGRRDSYA